MLNSLKNLNIDNSIKKFYLLYFIASTGDIITTTIGLNLGYNEVNPIIDLMWSFMGFAGIVFVKIIFLMTLIVVSIVLTKLINTKTKINLNNYTNILSILIIISSTMDIIATVNNLYVLLI